MASINAGSSVNCVHFHDFQNNFALIGCVSGVLMGFHYQNFAQLEADKLTQEVIYEAGKSITNIKTAKTSNDRNKFYIILIDNVGIIHILGGENSNL